VYGTRAKEVELPLFDGYLFCRFDPNRRLPILITPSVVYILGDGRSLVPVAEAEIDSLRRAVEARLALHPHDYLRVGEAVMITGGILAGVSGILLRLKKTSLLLSISVLRRSVVLEIDPDSIYVPLPHGDIATAASTSRLESGAA